MLIVDQHAGSLLVYGRLHEDSDSMTEGENGVASTEEPRSRRKRVPRPFPPGSFEEAVSFTRKIYEFNSGMPVRKLTFFDHLGKSPDSSTSRDSITSANKYGLLKSSFAAEQLELTTDGLAVVGEGVSPREQAKASIRLGIEGITIFKTIYERIAGNRLPARSALLDAFREAGVTDTYIEEGVDLLIVNMRYVGLLQVLSGAERVVTVDYLLDNVPAPSQAPSLKAVFTNTTTSASGAQQSENRTRDAADRSQFDDICFYITPIGAAGSDARKHSDLFLGSIVEPAIAPLGLTVVRADVIDKPGVITRQIIEYILRSRLVIADLSFHNPNVFYELALRHAARLPVVQIVRASETIPFDINQMRTIQIDNSSIYSLIPKLESFRADIAAQARRALEPDHEVDTPISVYFPSLRTSLG